MKLKKGAPEPETRVGNCCGCNEFALLFKVPNLYRYRCDTCFQKETGYRHHAAIISK
jgi:hypothetical protein